MCHYLVDRGIGSILIVGTLIETYRLMCLLGNFLSLPVAGRNQTDWVRHVRLWLLFYKTNRDALYVKRVEVTYRKGGCVTWYSYRLFVSPGFLYLQG
jgi:hypothetical protein